MIDEKSPPKLLSYSEVEDLTSLSRVTIWRKVREGSFPRPLRIGQNRVAWRSEDLIAWISAL
jgi:prophage regulatory protein